MNKDQIEPTTHPKLTKKTKHIKRREDHEKEKHHMQLKYWAL